MKFPAPKIRLAASVGINLTEHEASWCVMDKTPFGVRTRETGAERCVKQDWAVVLNKVLEKAATSVGKNAAVVIGLPASQSFFVTLPTGAKVASAEALLNDHHCCSSILPTELSADLVTVKVNGKTFAGVAASKRKDLQILTDVARTLGFRLVRVEPAPWALTRVSPPIRGNKMALKLSVIERHLLATLTVGNHPLLWRTMELDEDGDIESVVSLSRTFETYALQHLGAVAGLDEIVLDGPQTEKIAGKLSGDLGMRFRSVAGTGPTSAATAKGLALGGIAWEKPAPDLARPLAPPPQLWDLVPRGEVAVLGAVVACMGLWLYGAGTVAQNKAIRAEEDNARNVVLSRNEDAKLKDEKKQLSAEVQAVNSFLSNRVVWTEYLSQLSDKVPTGVKMVSFQGQYEMSGGEKNMKKPKRELMMSFVGNCPRDLPAPPETDQLLAGVRGTAAIIRDFPDIKLSSLRVNKSPDAGNKKIVVTSDPASFTIACLPKGKDAGAAAGGADKKDAGEKKADAKGAVAKAE